MTTVPIFQFMAVRFALLTQGSSCSTRTCSDAFQPYQLSGKTYTQALDWIGSLYQHYFTEVHKYGKRLHRMGTTSMDTSVWMHAFTERFLLAAGFDSDVGILYVRTGEIYPPLLGLSARQLSAASLKLLYELAECMQGCHERSLRENQQRLRLLKQQALVLNRPSEVFLTGIPIVAFEQALIQAAASETTGWSVYDRTTDVGAPSISFPRVDLSEPTQPLYSKDRIIARRLWQSAQRF